MTWSACLSTIELFSLCVRIQELTHAAADDDDKAAPCTRLVNQIARSAKCSVHRSAHSAQKPFFDINNMQQV